MKALTFLTLSLISLSAIARPPHTYDVPRGECLLFPKVLDLDKMVRGVHYKVDRDSLYNCDEDSNGNIIHGTCQDKVIVELFYRYSIVSTTEHYTADGKLFTTSLQKTNQEIRESSMTSTEGEWEYDYESDIPVDDIAKKIVSERYAEVKESIEREIAKKIYESNYGACADSYYK